jgi:hypothetical protein
MPIKTMIHQITKCKECYYFYMKSMGMYCIKQNKYLDNPNVIDENCPLPDKIQFIREAMKPNVIINEKNILTRV